MNFNDWPKKRGELSRQLEQEIESIMDAFRGEIDGEDAGIQIEVAITLVPCTEERFTDIEIEFGASI